MTAEDRVEEPDRQLRHDTGRQLSVYHGSPLTVFQLLNVPGLNKIWPDVLKPPEEFGNKNHNVRLEEKTKHQGHTKQLIHASL